MAPDIIKPFAEWASTFIELLGIGLIVILSLYALLVAAVQLLAQKVTKNIYISLRQTLGKGILVGLELLVAADIIHTVAVDLSFSTVGVLAIVVVIRTFLSFSLEVELSGRWPWQKSHKNQVQNSLGQFSREVGEPNEE